MTIFVNLYTKCYEKSHYNEIKYHMTLNIVFSVDIFHWMGMKSMNMEWISTARVDLKKNIQ
jgi:hypothetical protein